MESTRLLRLPELLAILGVSRSTVYNWMAKSDFPRPLQLSSRLVAWKSDTISAWIADRNLSSGWAGL